MAEELGLREFYDAEVGTSENQFGINRSGKKKENDEDADNCDSKQASFFKSGAVDFNADRIENEIKNLQDMALAISRQDRALRKDQAKAKPG